jgi:hypothetical protein
MNKLMTPVSDALLQEIRDYLDEGADMFYGGNDPSQSVEQNRALKLLARLDRETDGELMARRSHAR